MKRIAATLSAEGLPQTVVKNEWRSNLPLTTSVLCSRNLPMHATEQGDILLTVT